MSVELFLLYDVLAEFDENVLSDDFSGKNENQICPGDFGNSSSPPHTTLSLTYVERLHAD